MNALALSWRAFPNTNYGGKEMGMEHSVAGRQEVKARGRRGLGQCSRRKKFPSLDAGQSWVCNEVAMAWVWCLSGAVEGVIWGLLCLREGDEGSPPRACIRHPAHP